MNYNKLLDKYNDLEFLKIVFISIIKELDKKLSNVEYKFKNLKYDYENIMKTFIMLRKEKDKYFEHNEELKSKYYNLGQDNLLLRNKQVKNEKQIVTMNKEIDKFSTKY